MFEIGLGVLVGLVVGWNFLSQPVWVKKFLDNIRAKLPWNRD